MPTYIRWRISASTSSARPGLVAEGIADTNPSASARERIQLVYRIEAHGSRRHFRCFGRRSVGVPRSLAAACHWSAATSVSAMVHMDIKVFSFKAHDEMKHRA